MENNNQKNLETILNIIKTTPNDSELGSKVRKFSNSIVENNNIDPNQLKLQFTFEDNGSYVDYDDSSVIIEVSDEISKNLGIG